ncbi:hypothetical protein [Metabacillus litoralis]|nr:hypothetical protein [Metabacillus litoralis]
MDKKEIKQVVATFKEQINSALNSDNQSEEIQKAVYHMLKSLNIQLP